jgi:hypothetical protein
MSLSRLVYNRDDRLLGVVIVVNSLAIMTP